MIPEALAERARRHGLERADNGWFRTDPATGQPLPGVVVWHWTRGSGRHGWSWTEPGTWNIAEAEYTAEAEALSALLSWLDTQQGTALGEMEPRPATAQDRGPADDVLLAHPEHAEAAVLRWLDAHPDAAVRVVAALKAVGPWTHNNRLALGHDVRDPRKTTSSAGHVMEQVDHRWVARGIAKPAPNYLPGTFNTREAAMAAVDAALLAEGRSLAGGPVVLSLIPDGRRAALEAAVRALIARDEYLSHGTIRQELGEAQMSPTNVPPYSMFDGEELELLRGVLAGLGCWEDSWGGLHRPNECRTCNGAGIVSEVGPFEPDDVTEVDCEDCEGTGLVQPETAEEQNEPLTPNQRAIQRGVDALFRRGAR